MNKTAKPKYVPGSEVSIWNWFNNNQSKTLTESDHQNVASDHSLSTTEVLKLRQLWATGQRDSFNQAYYSMFDSAPTNW